MCDHASVPTYSVSRAWMWYQRISVSITIGGGAVMLAIAGIVSSTSSVPLLAIGLAWIVIGLLGLRANRACAQQVSIDGLLVTFFGPRMHVVVPMADVVEIRRSRGDINRLAPLTVVFSNRVPVHIAPRILGLIELFVTMRRFNPDVRLPEI
jgi:hypothetical protein